MYYPLMALKEKNLSLAVSRRRWQSSFAFSLQVLWQY
jgi:hypothetical protein